MAAPSIRGVLTFTSGTSAVFSLSELAQAGDLVIFVLESSQTTTVGGATRIAGGTETPVKLFEEAEGGGATGVTSLAVWAIVWDGSGGNVTFDVTTATNHIHGQAVVIEAGTHGVSDPSTDIVVGTGAGKSSGTSCVIPGITVTADSLILGCLAVTDDANDSDNITAFTNSNLATITQQFDQGTNASAGGGISCWSGTCAGTTTGDSTATHDNTIQARFVNIGIPPAAAGTDLVIQAAGHAHAAESPALTQVHELAVQAASHAHVGEDVALTQVHILAIADAAHAHAAENVVLEEVAPPADLVIQDASHAHAAEVPSLTQVHELAIQAAAHAHAAEAPSLTQVHQLEVQAASHAHAAESPALTQVHQLAIQDAAHAHAAESPTLNVATDLVIQDATHAHSSSCEWQSTLLSRYVDGYIESLDTSYSDARLGLGILDPDTSDSYVGQQLSGDYYVWESFLEFDTSGIPDDAVIEDVSLEVYPIADESGTDFNIEAYSRDWGGTLETTDFVAGDQLGGLTFVANLTTAGLTTDQYNTFGYIDSAFLSAINKTGSTRLLLASARQRTGTAPTGSEYVRLSGDAGSPARLTVYFTSGEVGLTQTHVLATSAAAHAHAADAPALTQAHELAVADAAHAHAADNVVLEVQGVSNLVIQGAVHDHDAENIVLTQVHVLSIQDGAHAHTVDELVLQQVHQLEIGDATHLHTSDEVVLGALLALVIQDAHHAHTASEVELWRHLDWYSVDSGSLLGPKNPRRRVFDTTKGRRLT